MCEVNLNGWTTAPAEANVATATASASAATVTTLALVARLTKAAAASDNTATTPTAASKLTINAAKGEGGGGTEAAAAASASSYDNGYGVKAAIGLDEEPTAPFANCKAYKADDAIAGSEFARYHQPGMEAIGSGQHESLANQLASRSRQTQNRKRRRGRKKRGEPALNIGAQHDGRNSNTGGSRINGRHTHHALSPPPPVEVVNNSPGSKRRIDIDNSNNHTNHHQEPMNLSQRQRLRHHNLVQPNHLEQQQQQVAAWLRQLSPSVRSLLGSYQGITGIAAQPATQQTVAAAASGELQPTMGAPTSQLQQYLPQLEATTISSNSNHDYDNGRLSTQITTTAPAAYHQLYPKPPPRTNQLPATYLDHRLLPPNNCYPSQPQPQATRQTVEEALQFASLHGLSVVASALQHQHQQSIFHQHLNQTTQYLIHQQTQLPAAHHQTTRGRCGQLAAAGKAKPESPMAAAAAAPTSSLLHHHQQGAAATAGRRPRELRKCRRIYGIEQRGLWCTQCKWKKACSRFRDPSNRRNLRASNSSGRINLGAAAAQINQASAASHGVEFVSSSCRWAAREKTGGGRGGA